MATGPSQAKPGDLRTFDRILHGNVVSTPRPHALRCDSVGLRGTGSADQKDRVRAIALIHEVYAMRRYASRTEQGCHGQMRSVAAR